MKKMILTVAAGMALLLGMITEVYAWSGDTWGMLNRETIEQKVNSMKDYLWTPKNTIRNWEYGTTTKTFYKGASPPL